MMFWCLGFAQQENLNTLDLYQINAPVSCQFALTDKNDSIYVYAGLELNQTGIDSSLWVKSSWFQGDQIYKDSTLVMLDGEKPVLNWAFTYKTIPQLFTIELQWKARSWTFQEHFPVNAYHPSDGLVLEQNESPVFRSWITEQDSVLIAAKRINEIFLYYYHHPFEPARPPMTLKSGTASARLEIDTIRVLSPNQYFKPLNQGLYFFQIDSSSTIGTAILVTDDNYPEPKTITDLTEPLVYITTKNEYQELSKDLSSKQALDKFWLSTVGSPEKARDAIKNFYHNIEVANSLFTSYKEGWKTDRGMIYAVMGPPLSVIKEQKTETWTYKENDNDQLEFVFKKIPNLFSNNHYELIRDKSLDRLWFSAIDRWRDGKRK